MKEKDQSFGRKVITNTTFALADLLLAKISTTVAFILLVRLLHQSDIALIGIGMGYIVLIAYLDIGPIRVLLRDYPKVSIDINKRDQLLSALFLFWVLQAVTMMLFCFGLHTFVFGKMKVEGLSFLFFGMTLDFIALTFQDWLKLIFYTDFKQSIATKISFFLP